MALSTKLYGTFPETIMHQLKVLPITMLQTGRLASPVLQRVIFVNPRTKDL